MFKIGKLYKYIPAYRECLDIYSLEEYEDVIIYTVKSRIGLLKSKDLFVVLETDNTTNVAVEKTKILTADGAVGWIISNLDYDFQEITDVYMGT